MEDGATRRRGAFAGALWSDTVAAGCWWFVVCLAATSAAKLAALASVYRHSDHSVLDELAVSGGGALPRALLLVLLLARDVLQCAAIATGVCAFAATFPRQRRLL